MVQVALSTVGKLVLGRNAYRRSILFHNPNAITVWLLRSGANGISTANGEIRLPEGSSIFLNWFHEGSSGIIDEWSAIAESGTPTIVITEFVGNQTRTEELERAVTKAGVL